MSRAPIRPHLGRRHTIRNKRGIAQAFPGPATALTLRRATVFDVFDLSRVLIRSITQLCQADHQNDPKIIAEWTANKDPSTIRGWITEGAQIWLAERDGQAAAVGGLSGVGDITLLYIDPDHTGCGVGAALLHRLVQELIAAGFAEGRLEGTRTAQGFYKRHGWQPTGTCSQRNDLSCFAMRKTLHPAVKG